MKRVLSIDGGGIRGIIPALICQKIEEVAGVHISSLFDLIAGTSTGGILALGLALPPHGKAATELVDFYFDNGSRIFSQPRGRLARLLRPKFDNRQLQETAKEVFGGTKISHAITELLVTSYDTQLRKPMYITKQSAKKDASLDFLMRDIVTATSAAPTYFPAHRANNHILIDGGVIANNPGCAAYAHAKKMWPDHDVLLLSIGTGVLGRPLSGLVDQEWGQLKWIEPLIDCLFDGTAQAVDDFFRYAHLSNYLRLQGNLSELTVKLDNVSHEAMTNLKGIGLSIFNNQEGAILNFLARLKTAGTTLAAQITSPRDSDLVPLGPLRIEGNIQNYRNERIYAFTGKLGRFWPSSRIIPKGDRWSADLNVGTSADEATVTILAVDSQLEYYIEFYRATAAQLSYPGMTVPGLPQHLHRIDLRLNHKNS